MKYMMDTNICVYIMNKRPVQVIEKFHRCNMEEIGVSSIVLSELHYGAHKSQQVEKNLLAINKFSIPVQVISYDECAAECCGEIRAMLEKAGTIIGAYDLMIAAHAISLNATLITNNLKEFSRIKKLKCENWV
ncbi:MAG: twitching motility protein PilT [Gammaproteobacteria bacterium RIFCSPLOWO2_02_FULL_42_14]|nr:MAG: twitching motility protein PilT [Gammaproteobacteria bacterium RIFCSPHIGHO2_02_FULL_42_43]OGT28904.1 MAG: twitching motility protein PilT [Gammaproteobacteria bacterium RIFCSPHIGHO2_01_FULL_42_8]OGT51519.1 MAG: twitching motility protein PilT [Gammaproteobacteria bacterium RIFCSPHIGHO2_12_FULL_41_25]OGT62220.1 MAG: twitching motility protein PilT [Gammaproteobacteria bacterium RIFCSPLOWO2_02_FULL_42_14]OGT85893.1 MAG: twitching motility protein PilT [Gammaproteobacteria bacterium RIFCSP